MHRNRMHPEESQPFAAATLMLRSEKATLYRESMAEIEDPGAVSDLDWDDEEDTAEWERSD